MATPLVIASGASVSEGLFCGTLVPIGVFMPAAWDAANLTFQALLSGTWYNIYDDAGTELTAIASTSRYIAFDPTKFVGISSVRVRSGTAGTPVNQSAER